MAKDIFTENSSRSIGHDLNNIYTPEANLYLSKLVIKLVKLVYMRKLYGFPSLSSHFSSKRKEIISKLNKIAKENEND